MSLVNAISRLEFVKAFSACKPPSGWGAKIAVAVSGGSDSLGLLFLVNRMLKDVSSEDAMPDSPTPSSILALTVDHALRPGSAAEADWVHSACNEMGIEHRTLSIPWSTPMFPVRPAPDSQFEDLARRARYHLLFRAMQEASVTTVVTGHHIDDQVETAVMRAGRGSTSIGLAGMHRCRRFGMGDMIPDGPNCFGAEGMRMWMVRPLLDFPKARIVKTCEENGVRFVEDETNFDPSLTVRNNIRHSLASLVQSPQSVHPGVSAVLAMATKDRSDGTIEERLMSWHRGLVRDREALDEQTTRYLSDNSLQSQISSFALDISHPPKDRSLEISVILRILRYVSPRPWGHPSAEAGRRGKSLQRIADNLWRPVGAPEQFIGGGDVMWSPGFRQIEGVNKSCWVASRTSPRRDLASELITDASPWIISAREEQQQPSTLLWDNRFLVSFVGSMVPDQIISAIESGEGRVILDSHGRWFLPRVVLLWDNGARETLAIFDDEGRVSLVGEGDWITFQWIRTLDAM